MVSFWANPFLLKSKELVLAWRFIEKMMSRVPVRSSISSNKVRTNSLILDTSLQNGRTKQSESDEDGAVGVRCDSNSSVRFNNKARVLADSKSTSL